MTDSIELNKTYTFTIKDFSFDEIPKEVLIELYKDGRVFAFISEKLITYKFNKLTHLTNNKEIDHIDEKYNMYEQKTFTKTECDFRQSKAKGVGRKDQTIDELSNYCKNKTFIIVSNINFPKIHVRFVNGCELLQKYPNGKIPKKYFNDFFEIHE